MKACKNILAAGTLAFFLAWPGLCRADGVKAGIFTLGVQVGNAEGVLWGLLNSFDTSVRAHPGAPPLLNRILKDAATTAKNLGTPTAGIEKLAEDLLNPKMTFAAMSAALTPLAAEQAAALGAKYPVPAVAIYQLGRDRSVVGQVADHPRNFPPKPVPNYRPTIATMAASMKANIATNKLEATEKLADDLIKMNADGTAYATMSTFISGTVLQKWTDDFLKAPAWGATGGPATLAIALGPNFTFGFTAPGGKKLTFSQNGSTNSTVVKINGQTLALGSSEGKVDRSGPLAGGGTQSVWTAKNIRFTQTLEPLAGQSGGPSDTVLVRWTIENIGGAPARVGLRAMIDTLIGGNDGVPFNVPGTGLVTTTADFRGNFPDFLQALEVADLQKPGTIAQVSLRMRGNAVPPDRVSLTRWTSSNNAWEIPMANMDSDSALVLYWDERDLPAGGSREIGFAYGLGRISTSVTGSPLATTIGGRVEAGHAFTVSSYVKNPVAGEKVTLQTPQGMEVVGPATVDVPAPPAGSSTSVVSWKAKATKPGSYELKIASSRGATQTQTVRIDPSTGDPIEKVIPKQDKSVLAAGLGRGAGKIDVDGGQVRIAVPAGQPGSATTFSKEPVTGNFDVELAFRLDQWQPLNKNFLHMRLIIAGEPRETAKTLVLIDRSAFGVGDRYGADVFQNGSWSGQGQIAATADKAGRLRLARRGNSIEMAYQDQKGGWRNLGRFVAPLPDAVYVGISAGNDLFANSGSPPIAVTISDFQVTPR